MAFGIPDPTGTVARPITNGFGIPAPPPVQPSNGFGFVPTGSNPQPQNTGYSQQQLIDQSTSGPFQILNPITSGEASSIHNAGAGQNGFGINNQFTNQVQAGDAFAGGAFNPGHYDASSAAAQNTRMNANAGAIQSNLVKDTQTPSPLQSNSGGTINWAKALPGAPTAATSSWGKQVNAAMAAGNYTQALQIASANNGLQYLLHPDTNVLFGANNVKTQAQYDAFYQAFAPYESKMQGQSSGGLSREGGDLSTVWGPQNASQALSNANVDFNTTGGLDPARFDSVDKADQNTNTQALEQVALTAAGVFSGPVLGPILGAATGFGPAAGGALAGAGVGAGSAALTGGNPLKGAIAGGVGGYLAGGGAAQLASLTNLPQWAISLLGGAIKGGISGGPVGAAVGGAVGGIGGALSGVPGGSLLTSLGGSLAGKLIPPSTNSQSGGTTASGASSGGVPAGQSNDPSAAIPAIAGAVAGIPAAFQGGFASNDLTPLENAQQLAQMNKERAELLKRFRQQRAQRYA